MYVQSFSVIVPLALSVIVNSYGLLIVMLILLAVEFNPVEPPFFLSSSSRCRLPECEMLVIVAGVLIVTLLSRPDAAVI